MKPTPSRESFSRTVLALALVIVATAELIFAYLFWAGHSEAMVRMRNDRLYQHEQILAAIERERLKSARDLCGVAINTSISTHAKGRPDQCRFPALAGNEALYPENSVRELSAVPDAPYFLIISVMMWLAVFGLFVSQFFGLQWPNGRAAKPLEQPGQDERSPEAVI